MMIGCCDDDYDEGGGGDGGSDESGNNDDDNDVMVMMMMINVCDNNYDQRTNGPVNAQLISWPCKAQNTQNLENIW